jgi:hypothetical protein
MGALHRRTSIQGLEAQCIDVSIVPRESPNSWLDAATFRRALEIWNAERTDAMSSGG